MAVEDITGTYRSYLDAQAKLSEDNSSDFNVDDFYQLLATQLQNQDMYSAQDDTKFLEQMVQIYSIQNMKEMTNVMKEMNEMNLTSYAFEFMGKEVTVADYDNSGNLLTVKGVVEKVTLYNGTPEITVAGKSYSLGNVMEVYPNGSDNASQEDASAIVEEVIEEIAGDITEEIAEETVYDTEAESMEDSTEA